tara:strand:+ start:632 stop:793 length:162 start_codon:yes stop_codon:yes gene_type:complete
MSKVLSKDLQIVRNFFSDDEWQAIESALADYADYEGECAELADSINEKVDQLF